MKKIGIILAVMLTWVGTMATANEGRITVKPPVISKEIYAKADAVKQIHPIFQVNWVAKHKIGAIGDSHCLNFNYLNAVDFYPTQLQYQLVAAGYSVQVQNDGNAGDTTGQIFNRLPQLFRFYTPEIVIVNGGQNDIGNGIQTIASSPTPTVTVFTVTAGIRYPAGSYVIVGGQSRQVLTQAGNVITLATALSSVPTGGTTTCNSDTQTNLGLIFTYLQAKSITKIVFCGHHYYNFSGGDTVTTPKTDTAALRALQVAACTAANVRYADVYTLMKNYLIANPSYQGVVLTFAANTGSSSETHLNPFGQTFYRDAIYAVFVSQGWLSTLN